MDTQLNRERAYYIAHRQSLSELYDGRFVVIKGEVVVATYDDAGWAAPKTQKRYAGRSFFVQKVASGTGTGHSGE